MKWSQFNIDLPVEYLNEERVIYNTFTDSRCILTPELDGIVKRACEGEALSGEEKNAIDQLVELGVLIPREVDEERELEYWFQKIKFDSSVFQLTVMTTYDCNLRCTYCFEGDVIQPVVLGPERIGQIINWVRQKLDVCRPQTVIITFFGGEPLLNWMAIEQLSTEIASIIMTKGITLEFQLITNGVLLEEEQINFLTSLGSTLVKVTLDGDEAAHNAKRPFSEGGGTFRTILNNLLSILGKVDLLIGGNFDETNLASIPDLLDRLRLLGFDETNCSFAFKPILAAPDGESLCRPCTYSDTKVEDILWSVLETEQRGLKAVRKIALQPCEALREWSFTVDPFGQLYKCPAMVGRPEGVVGDIFSENPNYTNTLFMTADHWKSCGQCSLRPICNGGCGLSAYMKYGDYLKIACERSYIEGVSLELIKEECLEAILSLRAQ